MVRVQLRPPPERPLPQDVFVIKLRRTYFGVHREEADGTSRVGLIAFVDQLRAARTSEMLWRHKGATGEWPRRVLQKAERLELEDRGPREKPSELRVDRVPLEWLKNVMGQTGGDVNLDTGVDLGGTLPSGGVTNMSGQTVSWPEDLETHTSRRAYLNDLFKKRASGEA